MISEKVKFIVQGLYFCTINFTFSHNIKADFLFERQNWTKKIVGKRLGADLAFLITRTKCMQNKNGLEICRIALQRIVLLKVYRNPGPNRSGIGDLKVRGPKKGPKTAQI